LRVTWERKERAMETYQTYPGRVRNGQPVITGNAVLPEDASIFVTVVKPMVFTPRPKDKDSASARRQAHRVVFEKFVKAMAEIDDEPLDEEFDAIISGGLKFRTMKLDL